MLERNRIHKPSRYGWFVFALLALLCIIYVNYAGVYRPNHSIVWKQEPENSIGGNITATLSSAMCIYHVSQTKTMHCKTWNQVCNEQNGEIYPSKLLLQRYWHEILVIYLNLAGPFVICIDLSLCDFARLIDSTERKSTLYKHYLMLFEAIIICIIMHCLTLFDANKHTLTSKVWR